MASLFLTIGVALAQKTVKGVVVSAEDNEGIPGASIRVKGTTSGISTNIDGKFTLTVPNSAKFLIVSSLGYKTQEVAIKPDLRIVMQPESTALVELVVDGYGSAKSITNTTASIVKVSSKSIQDKPVPNVMDALQGKVSGMQVFTGSGEPGSISSVKIHGAGTLSDLSSEPLYVLDGIPVSSGTIQGLNQNDFESIQVLKDASATSIYGSRAANGVVYLTSKKGKIGERATITVRGKYGTSSLANTDYYENLMNTEELLGYYLATGRASQNYVDKIKKDYPNDFKWYKYFYRDSAPSYDADIAVSGGAGRTSYYLSGSMLKSDGLRPRSSYSRYTMRANLNTSLNDYVSFGLKNSISYDKTLATFNDGLYLSGGLGFANLPWYSPFNEEGKRYYATPIKGLDFADIEYIGDMYPDVSTSLNVVSVLSTTIKPFKGFVLSANAGLNLTDGHGYDGRRPAHYGNVGNGRRNVGFSRSANWTFSNTAEYSFDINKINKFTLLAGHEYLENNYIGISAGGEGIEDDRLFTLSQVTKEKSISESPNEAATLSFFGRFSYNYDNKYFLDLTARNDAASRFGSEVRNGVFWSAGFKWRAKQESFLRKVNWIDNADVKLSHGTSGNSGIGSYTYLATVGAVAQYQGSVGWGINSAGNASLTWEKQAKTTLGFDFGFFDRLRVGLEFYNRVTSDMLMSVPQPATTGFSTIMQNVAKYQNRGIDLQLRAEFIKNKDGLNLGGFFNVNYNRDKILELFDGLTEWERTGTGLTYVVGQPLTYYTPLFKGINPENGFPEWYLPGEDPNVATRNDNKVTSVYQKSELNQNTGFLRFPPINGGWGLDLEYKGFYALAEFSFTIGKYMTNNDGFFTDNAYKFAGQINANRRVLDYWKEKGDIATYPSIAYLKTRESASKSVEFDSRLLENASFMRMKTLTLGYQVPQQLLAKQKFFKGMKIYATGRNLLTFTKYSGQDPEPDTNVSAGRNPNTKQVSVGLEVSF